MVRSPLPQPSNVNWHNTSFKPPADSEPGARQHFPFNRARVGLQLPGAGASVFKNHSVVVKVGEVGLRDSSLTLRPNQDVYQNSGRKRFQRALSSWCRSNRTTDKGFGRAQRHYQHQESTIGPTSSLVNGKGMGHLQSEAFTDAADVAVLTRQQC